MSTPTDPSRLLDPGSTTSPALRELLESAAADQPTAAQLAGLSARLGPLLAPPTPAGTSAPGAAPGAAGLGVKAKLLIAFGAVGLAGGGFIAGRAYEASLPRRAPVTQNTPVAAPAVSSPAPTVVVEPEPPPPKPAAPRPVRPAKAAAPKSAARPPPSARPAPDEEVRLLERAHQALEANPASGLALAEEHARRFADGILVQEREIIAIDALMRLDLEDDARARAARFRQEFPGSSHLLRVESLLRGERPAAH